MISCPACGREIKILSTVHDVPYFGKVLITSISCECGFKHSDSIITEIKDPVRYISKINKDNLFTKVIRSTSGTIRFPELGVDIEPGPASNAFITNFEGVLSKVEDIVKLAKSWNSENQEKVEICDKILEKISNTINGDEELTIIIEDPYGNSAIVSDDVFVEKMSEHEVAKLKTGLTVMDITGKTEEEIFEL
ncbi:ZPR1-related zinc finger protein [Archaeoglobus sulfaticallidus PM70-1]|uniref:ZPR1-related zinc finger protein n=1 Tax=Archaeoglobus sulfaticallidus PM70-1 TaxID=387631 RepID=N0B9D8_9EURY|nr:ZPR1 zinc finger domain-containing protein [Archaeoglobus sulfaticallidus]AGK60224.1 ZPR1-related zinc finger protein [Archaeoglobus sulfaticallidus PM70-1]